MDSGQRRFILVEIEADIARDITAERLRRVIEGYDWRDQRGNVRHKAGLDGGFRYCTLGPPLFDENGAIRPELTFNDLAAHIYFTETSQPLPDTLPKKSPFIGQVSEVAYYLLFNGVGGGSLLDHRTLRQIRHDGPSVVYADGCRLSPATLKMLNITFKQIPYQIDTR